VQSEPAPLGPRSRLPAKRGGTWHMLLMAPPKADTAWLGMGRNMKPAGSATAKVACRAAGSGIIAAITNSWPARCVVESPSNVSVTQASPASSSRNGALVAKDRSTFVIEISYRDGF